MGGTGPQLLFKCSEIICYMHGIFWWCQEAKKQIHGQGEEREGNIERNCKFCCHAIKTNVFQHSVLAMAFPRRMDFMRGTQLFGTSSGKAHLPGYGETLLLHESRSWLRFHRPVLTVFG